MSMKNQSVNGKLVNRPYLLSDSYETHCLDKMWSFLILQHLMCIVANGLKLLETDLIANCISW